MKALIAGVPGFMELCSTEVEFFANCRQDQRKEYGSLCCDSHSVAVVWDPARSGSEVCLYMVAAQRHCGPSLHDLTPHRR